MAERIKLGDLCYPSSGNVKLSGNELIDYVDISAVDNKTKRITGYTTYTFADSPSRARKAVKTNDVIVSTVRPNLNAVALFNIETPNTPVVSTGFCVLSCKETVNPSFVFNFCKSKAFIDNLVAQTTGASYPAVNDKIVRSVPIPSYSLSEQNDICGRLDCIQELIDIKQKELMIFDTVIKARFVEMFGDPEINQKGWVTKPLSEVIENANNGMARRGNDENGNIVLRLVELQDGYIDYANPNRIILDSKEKERYLLKDKDFLFARVNGNPEYVGRCAMFYEIGEPVYHNDHIIRVHFNERLLDGTFASSLFNSDYGKKQLRAQIKTSAGQYTVNQQGIGSIVAILPPIDEQKRFSDFVAQVDKSKAVVHSILDKLTILQASLMQEYFG